MHIFSLIMKVMPRNIFFSSTFRTSESDSLTLVANSSLNGMCRYYKDNELLKIISHRLFSKADEQNSCIIHEKTRYLRCLYDKLMLMRVSLFIVFGVCLFIFSATAQTTGNYQKGNLIPLRELAFDVGKASINLLQSNLQQLNELAVALQQMPDMEIIILGHTDVLGDVRMNKELSEQRAIAIKNYLAGLGISKKRIQTKGLGGTDPIVKETSALNRRIEVKVVENTGRMIAAPVVVYAVPDSVTKEMVVNQSIYNRLVKIIDLKKQEMAATKSKFEVDAARYKTLKAQSTNP